MVTDGYYTFMTEDDFDLKKIFTCGQCFRWKQDEDGSFTGVAGGRGARIRKDGNMVSITGSKPDYDSFWREYFDMDTDYRSLRAKVANCDYMVKAADFGAGIRILRQDRWEALCSFIFSQCNNITRITGIIERFCVLFGKPIEFEGKTVWDFPDPITVAALTEQDLAPLRSGYRAPYVLTAAREIAEGRLDLDKTAALPAAEALKTLKSLRGVGEKVANCVLLFGLDKRDAFPIDVWMKRALKENFPPDFDPSVFGENAGIAQQYIFYMSRSAGRTEAEKEKQIDNN